MAWRIVCGVLCVTTAVAVRAQDPLLATKRSTALPDAAGSAAPAHLADASNGAQVLAGFIHYKTYCAQCHGRNLQGQPLWHLQDADLPRRAPAQDDTGHSWQHPDEDLFQMIRTGHFPNEINKTHSFMPAFGGQMDDTEIIEVIAFIKSRWSLGIQVFQSSLNPIGAGMPARAISEPWTLPLNCISTSPIPPGQTASK